MPEIHLSAAGSISDPYNDVEYDEDSFNLVRGTSISYGTGGGKSPATRGIVVILDTSGIGLGDVIVNDAMIRVRSAVTSAIANNPNIDVLALDRRFDIHDEGYINDLLSIRIMEGAFGASLWVQNSNVADYTHLFTLQPIPVPEFPSVVDSIGQSFVCSTSGNVTGIYWGALTRVGGTGGTHKNLLYLADGSFRAWGPGALIGETPWAAITDIPAGPSDYFEATSFSPGNTVTAGTRYFLEKRFRGSAGATLSFSARAGPYPGLGENYRIGAQLGKPLDGLHPTMQFLWRAPDLKAAAKAGTGNLVTSPAHTAGTVYVYGTSGYSGVPVFTLTDKLAEDLQIALRARTSLSQRIAIRLAESTGLTNSRRQINSSSNGTVTAEGLLGVVLTIDWDPPAVSPPGPIPPVVPPPGADLRDPSETSIANAALICMGERRIESLEAESKAARILNERFDEVRDELLRSVPWNFATNRARLAADVDVPLFEFARQFTLPNDCLRLIDVDNPHRLPYRVEGRKIITNLTAPLDILYTMRITDPMEMDAQFRDVFAAMLALDTVEAITGDSGKLEAVLRKWEKLWAIAASANGQEPKFRDEEEELPGAWERARGRIRRSRVVS